MTDTRMDFAEKRSFRRMFLGTQAECHSNSGQVLHGVCENLSATGLLLESDEIIPEGQVVEVRIPSPTASMPDFHARCQVLRIESGQKKRNRIALNINEIIQ